jgi:hypothetical protein
MAPYLSLTRSYSCHRSSICCLFSSSSKSTRCAQGKNDSSNASFPNAIAQLMRGIGLLLTSPVPVVWCFLEPPNCLDPEFFHFFLEHNIQLLDAWLFTGRVPNTVEDSACLIKSFRFCLTRRVNEMLYYLD